MYDFRSKRNGQRAERMEKPEVRKLGRLEKENSKLHAWNNGKMEYWNVGLLASGYSPYECM